MDFTEKNLQLFELLTKAAKDDVSEVASIAVCDGDSILMGKRRDNGRWTMPGGHLDKGEEKAEGAVRELFEEAGIEVSAKDMKYLGSRDVTTFTGKKKKIHAFQYQWDGERPTTKNDPDKEVGKWEWIDCKDGIPSNVADNAHTPVDKNCVFEFLKLKPVEEVSKAEFEIYKSNYGPKYMKLYDPKANAERKQPNTGIEAPVAGPNKEVKQVAPGGRDTGKRQALREALEARKKSKANPVKIYSKEEIAQMVVPDKPKKLAASELEKQDFFDQSPAWQQSYLQNPINNETDSSPESYFHKPENYDHHDIPSYVIGNLLASGHLMRHPKRGIIRNRKMINRGNHEPLMRAEEGPLELVHYSPVSGLSEVDPNKMGSSGVRSGGQYKYGLPETKTSFHYIKGTEPEDVVTSGAKSKYKSSIHPQHLYDLHQDPKGLVNQAVQENQGAWNTDMIFKKIKDSGYKGIWAPQADHPVIRGTVQLFHPHPVEREEVL